MSTWLDLTLSRQSIWKPQGAQDRVEVAITPPHLPKYLNWASTLDIQAEWAGWAIKQCKIILLICLVCCPICNPGRKGGGDSHIHPPPSRAYLIILLGNLPIIIHSYNRYQLTWILASIQLQGCPETRLLPLDSCCCRCWVQRWSWKVWWYFFRCRAFS